MFFRTKQRALPSQRAHGDVSARLGHIPGVPAHYEVVGAVTMSLCYKLAICKTEMKAPVFL